MIFYLGTHEVNWLRTESYRLFVSHRRLMRYKKYPVAISPWALDSGGFTELSMYGKWQTSETDYVKAVRRYKLEIGLMEWAAPQDWMCEPQIVKKTGLSVQRHQDLTIQNLINLRNMAPDLHFIPVLQGWEADDYRRHRDQYELAGFDLTQERTVGIGTVCRRSKVDSIVDLVHELANDGIALHGFGVKMTGLKRFAGSLASADSMAWSYNARRNPPIDGHTHVHCNNCREWARRWRQKALAAATP